jgi:hypothetical protein
VTWLIAVASTLGLVVACSSSSSGSQGSASTQANETTAVQTTTTCGNPGNPPDRYSSVVVFSFENRTWDQVGLGFGPGMPFLHGLGQQCAYFTDWSETDQAQSSLTQYVGQVTGDAQPGTVNDCSPSAECSTQADNIFRQARTAGLTAINSVEGATTSCSDEGNAARHIPDLYMWGDDDRANCDAQVRPLSELNPDALPDFAFITPTLCNDGHDCADATVDTWAQQNIQPIIDSPAYKEGKVAVFVWYDEDHPVPNLWITPTATAGPHTLVGAGFAGTLAAWQSMLGLPCLAQSCTASDMRAAANS